MEKEEVNKGTDSALEATQASSQESIQEKDLSAKSEAPSPRGKTVESVSSNCDSGEKVEMKDSSGSVESASDSADLKSTETDSPPVSEKETGKVSDSEPNSTKENGERHSDCDQAKATSASDKEAKHKEEKGNKSSEDTRKELDMPQENGTDDCDDSHSAADPKEEDQDDYEEEEEEEENKDEGNNSGADSASETQSKKKPTTERKKLTKEEREKKKQEKEARKIMREEKKKRLLMEKEKKAALREMKRALKEKKRLEIQERKKLALAKKAAKKPKPADGNLEEKADSEEQTGEVNDNTDTRAYSDGDNEALAGNSNHVNKENKQENSEKPAKRKYVKKKDKLAAAQAAEAAAKAKESQGDDDEEEEEEDEGMMNGDLEDEEGGGDSDDKSGRSFICEKCGKSLTTINWYKKHKERCFGSSEDGSVVKPFQCPECDYKARHRYIIRKHQRIHGQFVCKYCKVVTADEGELDRHLLQNHANKNLKRTCERCSTALKMEEDYDTHMATCPGRGPCICSVCSMQFENMKSLKTHMKSHQAGRPEFHCEFCSFKTHYKGNLFNHLESHKEDRERKIKCLYCDSMFFDEKTMNSHLVNIHSSEKRYACSLCHKRFKTISDLNSHAESHNSIPDKYKCDFEDCTKSFKNKKILNQHKRDVHLSDKKYACEVEGCTMVFHKPVLLKKHMNTHTMEKKFPCEWEGCGKRFQSSYNLKIHYRQHTDEKPIKCDRCDYACRQKSSLIWHLKKHHDVEGTESGSESSGSKTKSPSPASNRLSPRSSQGGAPDSLLAASRGMDEYDFDSQEEVLNSDHTALESPFKSKKRATSREDITETKDTSSPDEGPTKKVCTPESRKAAAEAPPGGEKKKRKYTKKVKPTDGEANNQQTTGEPEVRKKRKYTKRKKPDQPEQLPTSIPTGIPLDPMAGSHFSMDKDQNDPLSAILPDQDPSESDLMLPTIEEAEGLLLKHDGVAPTDGVSSDGYMSEEIQEPPDGRTHADNIDTLDDFVGGDDEITTADIEIAEKELEKYVDGDKSMSSPLSDREQQVPNVPLPAPPPPTETADPMHYHGDISRQSSQDSVVSTDLNPQQSAMATMRSPMYDPYNMQSMPFNPPPVSSQGDGSAAGRRESVTSVGATGEMPVMTSPPHHIPPHTPGAYHTHVQESQASMETTSQSSFPSNTDYQGQPPHNTSTELPEREPVFDTELNSIKDITKDIATDNPPIPSIPSQEGDVPHIMPLPPPTTQKDSYPITSSAAPSSDRDSYPVDTRPNPTSKPDWPWPGASESYSASSMYPHIRPPGPLPDMANLHSSSAAVPSLGLDRPSYMGQYFPLSDASNSLSYPGQPSSMNLGSTYGDSQAKASDPKAQHSPDPRISSLHLLQRSTSDFFHRTSSSVLGERNYPGASDPYLAQQSQQQPWGMANSEERARQWGQNPLMPSLGGDLNTASSQLLKHPYASDRDYSASDPNKRAGFPSMATHRDPLNAMNHFDPMSNPYLSGHFPPAAPPGSAYPQPGASSATKHYDEAYRHPTAASHMSNYRAFPHQPHSTPGMFGSAMAGLGPGHGAMGLDKYYYPRDTMYRPGAASSFMPQTSTNPPSSYGDREYSHTSMYSQPAGAYGFMGSAADKQYLGSAAAKLGHSMPGLANQTAMHPLGNTRDYFPAPQPGGTTDPHDPYGRSVLYNMMNRYI